MLAPAALAEESPLIPAGQHLKLWAGEPTAAGKQQQTPLILIHGIGPDEEHLYSWDRFLDFARQNPAFHQRNRVWLFVFDPSESVAFNSAVLRQSLQELEEREKPERPFRLVALSMGGLIVRQAMAEEPAFAARVDRVIALGSPFHGTPLASPAWFRVRLKQEAVVSPMRLLNPVLYRITELKFPHFSRDFGWDDYNGAIPDNLKAEVPRPQYPALSPVDAEKFVAYAGFFGASAAQLAELQTYIQSLNPEILEAKRRRVRWGGGHYRMKTVQKRLADLPVQTCQDRPPLLVHLNDGLSPVASQLWLGRHTDPTDSPCAAMDLQWQALRKLNDHQEVRLFYGLDHRDWLEGQTRFKDNTLLPDWLHAQEPAKPLFEWMMHDLMRD